MDLTNKTIGIWGYGKEGKSILEFLRAKNFSTSQIAVLSDSEQSLELPDAIQQFHGEAALQKIRSGDFDIIFKSPGISLYRPEISAAKANGTVFSSATNLWFSTTPKTKTIIITGTKGKSTTASLLHFIMKESGLSVSLAGNIGISALDLIAPTEYTILELSSYQLADLDYMPDYFIALNLYPEHLQWHQTHEQYYQDKLAPLNRSDKNCTVIANADNKSLSRYLETSHHPIIWFNKDEGFHIKGETLYSSTQKLTFKSPLKGNHNLENIAAILSCCDLLKMNPVKCLKTAEKFVPLPHRLQEFISPDGVICVNDSISTTPETTLAALEVYKNAPLFLILGGTDRGQDYSTLINKLPSFDIRGIAFLPKNGERLYKEMANSNFTAPIFICNTLEQATKKAKEMTQKGDVVLLSPAAPSYDQFQNFEERGNLFIKMMSE